MSKLLATIIMVTGLGLVAASFGPLLIQPAFAAGGGSCSGCAKLVAPGTESGTGGTIGGGHEPAKTFAPGQLSSGSASEVAPGHVKPYRYYTIAVSMTSMHKLFTAMIGIAIVLTVATTVSVQPAFATGGNCNNCAKLSAPGTESGTGGTIGGGHEPAKAFAPGQLSSGSASDSAPGHLKP